MEERMKTMVFHIIVCAESNAAIKMIDNCNPDVILTSLSMVNCW